MKTITTRKRAVNFEELKLKCLALYIKGRSLVQIKDELNIDYKKLMRWKKQECWDTIKAQTGIQMKKVVQEEAIKEGLLNIKKIRELQNDCINVAKNLRSENRDASLRTAIKLEELNLKKQLLDPQSKGNKSIAGLMTLLGDNE